MASRNRAAVRGIIGRNPGSLQPGAPFRIVPDPHSAEWRVETLSWGQWRYLRSVADPQQEAARLRAMGRKVVVAEI
jgi:hypothetical protein